MGGGGGRVYGLDSRVRTKEGRIEVGTERDW